MATGTAIARAAAAGATIVAGAGAADTITAGATIADIDTRISPATAFVDPLPRRK